jgi:hypothetical protein
LKRLLSLAVGGLLVGVVATIFLPSPLAGADICGEGVDAEGDLVTVCYQTSAPGTQNGGSGRVPHRGGGVATTWFYFQSITYELKDNNGKPNGYCVGTFRTSKESFATLQTGIYHLGVIFYRAIRVPHLTPCPISAPPRIPLPGAANPLNNASVTEAFQQELRDAQQLSPPQLKISPSSAIPGLPVFMSISGAQNTTINLLREVAGHQVHVVLNSTYDIDWGDGTAFTTSSQGGPFPNGDVQHTYVDSNPYVIVVRQHWKGRWTSDDGRSGTIVGDPLTQASASITILDAEAILTG